MQLPETSTELSQQLIEVLLTHGERQIDKIQHIVVDAVLGEVKLNDYWNGFHKNHEGWRHSDNPDSFYAEGNIPILGVSSNANEVSILIFRPTDFSLRGMGRSIVERLPEDLMSSDTTLTLKRDTVLTEPLNDSDLEQMLRLF